MEEIQLLRRLLVVAALGKIAYDALVGMFRDPKFGWRAPMEARGLRRRIRPEKPPPFAHGVEWEIRLRGESPPSLWLVGSYHPSRQNTQTGRLTRAMFDRVWRRVRKLAYPEKV